jgi:hypothetical protein
MQPVANYDQDLDSFINFDQLTYTSDPSRSKVMVSQSTGWETGLLSVFIILVAWGLECEGRLAT